MILTKEQIRTLIALTQLETVVPKSDSFPFRVVRQGSGYAEGEMGQLQAKLSIMLEMAS